MRVTIFIGYCCLVVVSLVHCRSLDEGVMVTPVMTPTETMTPVIGVSFITMTPPSTAVWQITPTPRPTATATATPTPIIYFIEEGDTLLGLAIAQGTTVEEIEALNEGIRAELLQIGQVVQLPPPATAVALAQVHTPVPIQVRIHQIQSYQTPVGSLWLLGEVVNDGEQAAENVQVQIDLADQTGAVVDSALAWTALPILPPGGYAPFGVLVPDPPANFDRPLVSVVDGQTVTDLGSRYLDVMVTDASLVTEGDSLRLEGEIVNSGTVTATQILVVSTLYDSQGRITGYHQLAFEDTLPISGTFPFAFEVVPTGGQVVVDYRLAAQAQLAED